MARAVKRQKRMGAKVGFGNRRNCQGVAKTKGLGAKRRGTQKKCASEMGGFTYVEIVIRPGFHY